MDENAERITSLGRMIGVLGLLALSLSALGTTLFLSSLIRQIRLPDEAREEGLVA
jgi:hypothetical protein